MVQQHYSAEVQPSTPTGMTALSPTDDKSDLFQSIGAVASSIFDITPPGQLMLKRDELKQNMRQSEANIEALGIQNKASEIMLGNLDEMQDLEKREKQARALGNAALAEQYKASAASLRQRTDKVSKLLQGGPSDISMAVEYLTGAKQVSALTDQLTQAKIDLTNAQTDNARNEQFHKEFEAIYKISPTLGGEYQQAIASGNQEDVQKIRVKVDNVKKLEGVSGLTTAELSAMHDLTISNMMRAQRSGEELPQTYPVNIATGESGYFGTGFRKPTKWMLVDEFTAEQLIASGELKQADWDAALKTAKGSNDIAKDDVKSRPNPMLPMGGGGFAPKSKSKDKTKSDQSTYKVIPGKGLVKE